MKIGEFCFFLESIAPPQLQENYDNSGLIIGDKNSECSGILCSLDVTEEVIDEAIATGCNLVIAHHPVIFQGLKKINGKNYVERVVISAIKNDIAVFAIHTNLDNVISGVNGRIALKLSLQNVSILSPKAGALKKLYTFVPTDKAELVRNAIFAVGAGRIGNYSECSFNTPGTGSFKAQEGANPFVGDIGHQHLENETRIEMVFPYWIEKAVVGALTKAHPYEEPAYDLVAISNEHPEIGSGLVGELPGPISENECLALLKEVFTLSIIRHTALLGKPVRRIAVCGGAGSFLLHESIRAGAELFVTSDMKYHQFFDADGKIVIADIGHYESEQFTVDLLVEILGEKFPNFAVLKTRVQTNPVRYFVSE